MPPVSGAYVPEVSATCVSPRSGWDWPSASCNSALNLRSEPVEMGVCPRRNPGSRAFGPADACRGFASGQDIAQESLQLGFKF